MFFKSIKLAYHSLHCANRNLVTASLKQAYISPLWSPPAPQLTLLTFDREPFPTLPAVDVDLNGVTRLLQPMYVQPHKAPGPDGIHKDTLHLLWQ